MPETGPWRDGGGDRLVARADELLKRFEQVEEDESWTPASVAEHWGQLRRAIQQKRQRRPSGQFFVMVGTGIAAATLKHRRSPGQFFAMVGAGAAVAAVWIALVWSHQSAVKLPPRSVVAQSVPAVPTLAPAQSLPERATAEGSPWTAWPRTDLGANGALWTKPGSTVRLPASPTERSSDPRVGYLVRLETGSLCTEVAPRDLRTEGPFVVKTRQLDVTVIGTLFCVEASPELSSVSVQRGRVRVSHEEAMVVLEAGESIRSDSPRLRSARPSERLVRERVAPGNPIAAPEQLGSLALENELFQRALQETRIERHAQAAGLLADYLKRFPVGLYAPEAGSKLATELALAGRPAEALAAADERLRSFPRDPHDGDVKLFKAGLLRDGLGRPADALAIYDGLLDASAGPEWRAEALFGKGACEQKLGDLADAEKSWRRYANEYPGGRHAAEVERLLGE